MNKKKKLENTLLSHIRGIQIEGSSGRGVHSPEYELYALDYIKFAENNIKSFQNTDQESQRINELISCVANLKRSLACQIECFLHVYGILPLVKKKNLSMEQKETVANELRMVEFLIRSQEERDKRRSRLLQKNLDKQIPEPKKDKKKDAEGKIILKNRELERVL